MTHDPIDTLIRDVAAKHGVAVGRDDPILILHTLNEHLLRDSAKAQSQMLATMKEELEYLTHQWDKEHKARAERILNASLTAAKQAMQEATDSMARTCATAIRYELEVVQKHAARTVQDGKRLAFINAGVSSIGVAAAAFLAWAHIAH